MRRTIFFILLLLIILVLPSYAKNFFCIKLTSKKIKSGDNATLEFYLERLKESLSEYEVTLSSNCSFNVVANASVEQACNKTSYTFSWNITLKNQKKQKFSVNATSYQIEKAVKLTRNELLVLLGIAKPIKEIKITGNLRVSKEFILDNLTIKKGDLFSLKKLDANLKRLYKFGYFENIEIYAEEQKDGYVVWFKVKENPAVRKIIFKGNKEIGSDDLKRVIGIEPDTIITPKILDRAVQVIKQYYLQEGYIGTKVEIEEKKVSPTQVDLIFHIKEGLRLYIKKIIFKGNKAFSDEELKSIMSLSEKTSFSWLKKIANFFRAPFVREPLAEPGVFNKMFLYKDLGTIETFYKNHGYIDAKVGEPIIKRKKNWVTIIIPIKEGKQYRVGSIKVKQDLFPQKVILRGLRLKKGDVFSLKKFQETESYIESLFADHGYAYVRVVPEIEKDTKHNLVNITLDVKKGPVVYINRITIEGNTKTRDKVIRRQLRIAEGWPYSAKRIAESELYLRKLGFFKSVEIKKEKAAKDNEINLKVKVDEMLTGTFSVGGGYSSYDKFMFMMDLRERNFLGLGYNVSLSARFGSKTTRYSLNFYDPYFMDTRYSLGYSLYNYSIEYTDFTKHSKGGSVRIGYNFSSKLYGYIGYRYDDTRLSDLSSNVSSVILESENLHITSAFQIGGSYDSRNSFFMPTKGWYHRVDVEYAQGLFGGDSRYIKVDGGDQVYHEFCSRLIGHIRFGYGYITEGDNWKIPVYERYFLGGINTVRGYSYGSVSPIDPKTGEKIGGTRIVYVQNELLIPLIKSIYFQGVLFFDAGSVWDRQTGFHSSDIKKSWGFGFRWFSPIGPIRLEWGFNINPKPGEEKSNFNFQIGGFF
ncbi:MAG: outer membrane protein assembly factor BamA [Thermodesulfobacteria bacterium]|nr:outer membrane protein assembly factor BamA [Thermodesulfobacteriota bacterium]